MERYELEPGLLPIFRVYILIRAVGLALVAAVKLPEIEPVLGGDILLTAGLYLTETAFLLIYLFSPKALRRLGPWYLPVALFVAASGPIIEMRYIFSVYHVEEVLDFWLIFPFLTVPLLITAWQYSFNEVLLYSLGTTLLELLTMGVIASARQVNLWFNGGLLTVRMFFLIVIGYIVSYLMTEQRRQRRELAEANRKLTRFAAAQEQIATLRERNRLARELHDTVAHTLSGLTVQLDALAAIWQPEEPRAQRMLSHALSNARVGLDETRRALQDLRAAPLEDLGLALAIRYLAESVTRRADLALTLDLPEDLGNLPKEVEQAFYRVTQEALTNIAQHADARAVSISLEERAQTLKLVITDDGRGFDLEAAEAADRFGIHGMRERASLVGGALTIATRPNSGTRIRLTARVTA
jgi:signal transduction histidine kinase